MSGTLIAPHGLLAAAAEVEISGLRPPPGKIHLGVEWKYWQNKYEIEGLKDNVWLPLFVWKL